MNRTELICCGWFLVLAAGRAADLQCSNVNAGVSLRLNAVAYGTDRFVAVGTNSTTITSSLGTDPWRSNSVPAPSVNLQAVTFGNGMFVAGGQNRAVYSSTDG